MAESRKEKKTRALVTYASLKRAVHALDHLMDRQCQAWGLSPSQLSVLEQLLLFGPMATGELAERILFGDSTVSAVTKNLARAGLVVRRADESDGRKVIVELTGEGRELVRDLLPERAMYVRAKMCVLGKREEQNLARLCRKLAAGDEMKFVLELTKRERDEEEE